MEVGSIVNFCAGAGAPEDAGGLGKDAWSIKAHSDTQARQQELVAHYTAARTPQLSEVGTALGRVHVSQRKGPSARHIHIKCHATSRNMCMLSVGRLLRGDGLQH